MNQVLLSGSIVGTPTSKTFDSGVTLVSATVRVEGFVKKGEAPKHDDVRVDAWGDAGKVFVRAGTGGRVIVNGRVRVNTWTKQDGSVGSATNIVANSVEQLVAVAAARPAPQPEPQYDEPPPVAPGDEIPF